jgi:very long chain acyl-CoA dehydrogenase
MAESKKPPESKSYAVNMFRGIVHQEQVFPFADVLTTEQRETLEMLVDPTDKFFKEMNDPAKNDEDAQIPESTLQGLKDMGAFGLQVSNETKSVLGLFREFIVVQCENTDLPILIDIYGFDP